MSTAMRIAVVAQQREWATMRVRGLLRNGALGRQLAAGADEGLDVRLATGTVRVRLTGGMGLAQWVDWLTQRMADASAADEDEVDTGAAKRRRVASPRRPARALSTTHSAAHAKAWEPAAVHARAAEALLRELGDGAEFDLARGLDPASAAARLERDGPNEIRDITARSAADILRAQFRSVPVALLGGSAALALATRAFVDAGAIAAVLGANATLGYVTERQAEATVSSLRQLGPGSAAVLRGGEVIEIPAREVVVGDLLVLRPGLAVAADARVLEAHRLAVNEAALTGESLPVRKAPTDALARDTPLGERRNMVFMGTVVSGGAGLALVVATAEHAALGRIRQLAQTAGAPHTRLQHELDALGRRLAIGASLLCGGVFVLGLLRGRPMLPLLRTTVALGVAAIPEGLPTVATSLLARAVRELRERQVYARRLDAIENLGAVDTVCFDKTGTLTENRMSVATVSIGTDLLPTEASHAPLPQAWLRVAALCNSLVASEPAAAVPWTGSSTELALLVYAQQQGADVATWRRRHPALAVRHRSEHHPYMVTLHDSPEKGLLVAVKGRPDEVLSRCEAWHDGQAVRQLDEATRQALLALNQRMAQRGERVLALACREQSDRHYGDTGGLVWLGLAGLADPLRPGLPDMMARFRAAGIRPMMITGDQPATAQAVAERVGLDHGAPMLDAARLPESADAIAELAERSSGFARTSPAMKLEIVRALQQRGHVVAMTGDGINDGPALKRADVGVAMGVSGTDFAHAMSDLVLRDDHPAAMLKAIEQGRAAFLNVRKSVRYLMATNLSELAATTVAVAAGLPEPFDPLALLWTNIATDIWPAIALGLEPAEPGLLERPPVSLRDGLLDRADWTAVATDAGVMTLASLASFAIGLARYGPGPKARTMAFMALTSSQLLYALAVRSPRPLRRGGLLPNPVLRHAVGWSLAAQAGTVLLPAARRVLRTAPLGLGDIAVVAVASVLPLLVREALKERALPAAGARNLR